MEAAKAYLAQLEALVAETSAPYLRAQAAYARPLIADDDQAEELYQAALERDLANGPASGAGCCCGTAGGCAASGESRNHVRRCGRPVTALMRVASPS